MLARLYVMFSCVYAVLCQVWYLIVSILALCLLPYVELRFAHFFHITEDTLASSYLEPFFCYSMTSDAFILYNYKTEKDQFIQIEMETSQFHDEQLAFIPSPKLFFSVLLLWPCADREGITKI